MTQPHENFAFVDAGRTFTCEVETPRRPLADAWWWFRVSTEDHQRYAPFRADGTDTPDTVRDRVIAYYDDLLARRADRTPRRWQRGSSFTSASTANAASTAAPADAALDATSAPSAGLAAS